MRINRKTKRKIKNSLGKVKNDFIKAAIGNDTKSKIIGIRALIENEA